nr:AlpA family transcriptional regulator [uncultured Vibrio sp.]
MRLLKLKDVMHTTNLARSTIYKYINDGNFPKPISLNERNVAWLESEIEEWILEKIEQRDMTETSSIDSERAISANPKISSTIGLT